MPSIDSRLAKLEQHAHGLVGHRTKEERDAAYNAVLGQARAVAAVCATWQELAAYLKSIMPIDDQDVVSIERRRQIDAIMNGSARSIFEEVRHMQPAAPAA